MSTALATTTDRWGLPREQIDLIKRTIARDTNDDEFALFMSTANRLGLDPFAKQIYAVMRNDKREGRKVMTVQVSIDGFRSTADKTGERDGEDGPYWCGLDGVWHQVWLADEAPRAAKITVFRKGSSRGYTGIATWASYVQTDYSGKPNNMWAQFPDTMLAKCAEALALRKAFPAQLSGVYTPDEMGQAENSNRPLSPLAEAVDREMLLAAGDPTVPAAASPLPAIRTALIADIDLAPTVAALNALMPRFKDLPRKGERGSDGTDRAAAHDAYKARLSVLTRLETNAEAAVA